MIDLFTEDEVQRAKDIIATSMDGAQASSRIRDEIITDEGAPQEELERIRSAGVKLTVVGK